MKHFLHLRKIYFLLIALGSTLAANGQMYCPININLEQGSLSGWQFQTARNLGASGISGLATVAPISGRHTITSGTTTDYYGGFPVVDPVGGTYSLKVGNDATGGEVDQASYTFTVPASINNYSLIYRYAVVFENPAHLAAEQPWFKVRVYDSATGNNINCASFTYISSSALPGFSVSTKYGRSGGSIVYYKPWSTASLNLSGQAGKTLVLEFTSADCSLGGHMGYGYVDVNCGLFAISSSTCNATTPLSAPPGFASYKWYNSNYTTVVGNGQSITVPTPTAKTKYNVVLTPYSGYGCSDTLTTEIFGSTLAVNAGPDTAVCNVSSVTLNPTATGNAGPYTYAWTPSTGLSCASCQNPAANPAATTDYIVTVTDTLGCSRRDTVQVKPAPVVSATASPASCFGAANGALSATATRGKAPYTYSWNTTPVANNASANGIAAGAYTVTATDANGCRATNQATVTQPARLVAAISSVDSVSCNGGTDGRATAMASGGKAPYTYSWNTAPAKTTATASQLSASAYLVTVTDSVGCSDTESVVIPQPTQLAMSLQRTAVTCAGSANGTVAATATGGTAPYSYAIGTGAFSATNTFSNLAPGTYTLHLRDAKSCVLDSTVTITQPTPVRLSWTTTQPLCNGAANGQITMSGAGGTSPYQYAVNTGSYSSATQASSLAAGSYIIHLRDAAGCQVDSAVVLSQPQTLGLSLTQTSATCHGTATGTATGVANGGTAPYAYAMDNGAFGSTTQFTSLAAGTHILHLRDASGCTKDSAFTIAEPAALAMTLTPAAPACNGAANGQIQVSANGGNAPYQYALNTGAFATNSTFSALAAGSYIVHLRDASGCTLDSALSLQQPNGLAASFTTTTPSCANGSNGTISVSATGGSAPYTYAVNSGSYGSSNTLGNLPSGTYTVHVRDARSCQLDSQIVITLPTPVRLSWTTTQPLCNGAANGQITMSGAGGTSPYQYAVNTGSYSSTAQAGSLAAGSYTIHLRDAAGCQADSIVVLTQPQALSLALSQTPATCHGTATGTATGAAAGGTSPYQYAMDNGSFGSSAQFSALAAGTHILHLRDASGCTKDSAFTIAQPAALAMTLTPAAPACNGAANGQIQVSATGGNAPYQYALNTGAFTTSSSFTALAAGVQLVHLRDASGCTLDSTTTLQQPASLAATFTTTPITCASNSNGAISVSATGGTAPYTYALNAGSYGTASTLSNLAGGTYTVHIRDARSCQLDSQIVILQPNPLRLSWTATQPLCNGAANGQATLTATGGTSPYQYAFNTGNWSSSAQATNLTAGAHMLHVRDAAGCQVDSAITMAQPQALSLSLTAVHNVCHGIAAGAVSGSVTGGVAPYQYALNSGSFASTPQFNALAAGTYTFHLRDAAGCTKDSIFTITEPAALAMSISSSAPACNGNASGQIQVTPTGGRNPYQLALNNGSFGTASSFNSLQAATYVIHLRDNYGCTLDSTVSLQQPGSLSATATVTAASCNGGSNGGVQLNATGGTAPYSYSWNGNSATTSGRSGLSAGTYAATVTDSRGCTFSVTANVSQPVAIAATISTNAPLCNGGSNGSASAVVTGGTAPYSYSWTGSTQTAASATGFAAGSYTLTVTDGASCTASFPLTISAPPAMTVAVTAVSPTCYAGANGKAFATVTNSGSAVTYNWQSLSGQTTDTARGLAAGTYSVTVTNANGCTATGSATVTNPDSMTIQVSSRGTCAGSAQGSLTALATGGNPPYIYQWNTVPALPTATASGLTAGNYRVVVTDAHGCRDSVMANVDDRSGIDIVATVAKDTVCQGSPVQLRVAGASSYSWTPSNILNCSSCDQPLATPQDATTFTVIGVDSNGCRDTATVHVAVMKRTAVSVAKDVRICQGDSATLQSFGGTSLFWMTANAETTGIIRVAPQESASYGVVITENRCFTDTLYQHVEVLPTPTVEVGQDIEAAPGTEMTLRADMQNASTITWIPAQGLSCSNCVDPIHRITGKAIYVAKVSNDLGCTATDTVRISDECDARFFYFANMFSPNADGNNDRFYPQGAADTRIDRFQVYDRWGEVVFSAHNIATNDAAAGWDGTFRNQQLKADVYVFVMDAVCTNGKKIVIRGDVTLVR